MHINTHIQQPAEGVLLHTDPLLLHFTTVVVTGAGPRDNRAPPELAASKAKRETHTEEPFVIVCVSVCSKRVRLFKSILSPQFCLNSKVRIRGLRSLRSRRDEKWRMRTWVLWWKGEVNKKEAWKIWSYTLLNVLSAQKSQKNCWKFSASLWFHQFAMWLL